MRCKYGATKSICRLSHVSINDQGGFSMDLSKLHGCQCRSEAIKRQMNAAKKIHENGELLND